MNRSLPIFILLCILALGPGRPGWAGYRQFLPKYVSYSAEIGMRGLYERDKTSSGNNSRKNKELTFQEGLGVKGLGYIYSPLFISMQTSVGFGLLQERITRDDSSETKYGDANQFKQVFKILPAHPYNFELYGLRSTPMTSGGGGATTVINEYGAMARYEMRPWNSSLTYMNRESRSDRVSENDSLIFNTNYFNTRLGVSTSCLYAHNESDTDASLAKKELLGLKFNKKFESARFVSRWNHDRQDQKNSPESSIQSSDFEYKEWHNELALDFPRNFSVLAAYDVRENETQQKTDLQTSEFFNDSERYSFRLKHQLYKSLSTGFIYNHNYTESNSGRATQENSRLNGSYTKKIPWGTFLSSLSGGVSYLDNTGAVRTLSQPRSVSSLTIPPNSFSLNLPLIERDSIIVRIIDLPPNEINKIILTEGTDYNIIDIIGGYRITINPIATSATGLVSTGGLQEDYGYEVDFIFIPSDYELRTTTWNGKLQLPLFNKLITPFYSYSDSEQTVMEGNYPATAEHSKTHTLGLGFVYNPFRGEIGHSWLRSTTNSDDRLNATLEYSNQLTPFTSSHFTLAYEDAHIEEETTTGSSREQDETLYGVQANLQTIWPQINTTGSVTGNYSLYKGSGETSTYSLFSVLSWHVGQLDLDLTATYTDSESKYAGTTTKDEFTMVRFILKRQLF
jgi:hypothetical protein